MIRRGLRIPSFTSIVPEDHICIWELTGTLVDGIPSCKFAIVDCEHIHILFGICLTHFRRIDSIAVEEGHP